MDYSSQLKIWLDKSYKLLRKTPPIVFAVFVLSIGLSFSANILATGLRATRDTITVTGTSTERITSDNVNWRVKIYATAATQQLSYQFVQPSIKQVMAFLKDQGITINEIETKSLNTSKKEVRNPRTGELISTTWTTAQYIDINSNDVKRVQTAYKKIGKLLGKGIYLTIYQPAFTYTKLAEKRVEMLAKATRDAKERAKAIAKQTGSGIGSITTVNTGVFQITIPNSTSIRSMGSYDTTTIEKDITAIMGVTFKVN